VGEIRDAHGILFGHGERKRPLGRLSHGCEDDIKINLNEIWSEFM
jgi:hypothetical protein